MAAPCKACTSDRSKEINRRLRSGTTITDVVRWLASVEEPIGRNALGRHVKSHLGMTTTPGPRPMGDSFLRDVVTTAHEDLAAGVLRPSIRDAIGADTELARRSERESDRDLMLKIALALTGNVQYLEGEYREIDPESAALEAEYRALLTPGDDYSAAHAARLDRAKAEARNR